MTSFTGGGRTGRPVTPPESWFILLPDVPPAKRGFWLALLARPGQAVAKERLSELVFPGEAHVQADAIEVVAYRLRKKLAHTGAQLVTLRGLGYLLKAET